MRVDREKLVEAISTTQDAFNRARLALKAYDQQQLESLKIVLEGSRVYVRRDTCWECRLCGKFHEERLRIQHDVDCPLFGGHEHVW